MGHKVVWGAVGVTGAGCKYCCSLDLCGGVWDVGGFAGARGLGGWIAASRLDSVGYRRAVGTGAAAVGVEIAAVGGGVLSARAVAAVADVSDAGLRAGEFG